MAPAATAARARAATTPAKNRATPANNLLEHHGQDAPIHAAMRADAMLEAGDLDGYVVWKRILRSVEELQGVAPKSGEAVH